jgi:hypothetical protein
MQKFEKLREAQLAVSGYYGNSSYSYVMAKCADPEGPTNCFLTAQSGVDGALLSALL